MATVNVSTFLELRDAIEDSTSTEILVTSDITFSSGGAKVNTAKSNLVIDFGGHTITGYKSVNFTDTIFVSAGAPEVTITVKNAIWNGFNYYGIVGVYDGNTLVTLVLDNINYKGPQLVYNKNGITKINNCEIVIDKNESTTTAQELCEANRVFISGKVVANLNTTSNAVIWFTNANASLTVEENSYFEVNALYTYFLYTDSSPALTFKKNSTTFINTKNGLFYSSGSGSHIASSFTLEENATFASTQNEKNSTPMFKCLSSFSLGKNSNFSLFSPATGSTALMYFGQTALITISSPKSVVLYNNGGNIFAFQTGSASAPNTITIDAEMMRFWSAAKTPLADAGGFDDEPTSSYHKSLYASNLNVTFKLSNAQLLSADNNLEDGDKGYPLSTSTPLMTSKVIAMGQIPLSLDKINDLSTAITGEARPSANMKVSFDDKTLTEKSGENGDFSIALDERLAVGTPVKIEINKNFLTKSLTVTSEGSVSITSLKSLDFYAFTSPPNTNTIYRIDNDWEIEVTDTRTTGGLWYLYAYINAPLTSGTNTLDDALMIKNDTTTFLSQKPLQIYIGNPAGTQKVTKIKWEEMKGFLLYVEADKAYPAGKYTTELFWQVTTAPLE